MDEGRGAIHTPSHNVSESKTVGGQANKTTINDQSGERSSRLTQSALTSGIVRVVDILDDMREIYVKGLDRGESPGWSNFGEFYRVRRGMMTIVTGIPSSGKSEFVDAMLVNLAGLSSWKFAVFSPENYPVSLHVIKLMEKFIGTPYPVKNADYKGMGKEDIRLAVEFIGKHFAWIYPDDEKEPVTLDTILIKALTIKELQGLDGLVVDPWNEIENNRGTKSETEHISESLTKIRRWARKHQVHVWVVAHPQKLSKNKEGGYDPPTPYDISGSAHWRNKADFCLCVHRGDLTKNTVEVYTQKIKFKHLGKPGKCTFIWEFKSGRFKES